MFELELDLYSALGRIRGALDLHPACIGGALQRSWRAEWGRRRAATTDRPSLSLTKPAHSFQGRPRRGEGHGQTSRLNYALVKAAIWAEFSDKFVSHADVLEIVLK